MLYGSDALSRSPVFSLFLGVISYFLQLMGRLSSLFLSENHHFRVDGYTHVM